MKQMRQSLINLVIGLTLFFNIERLDFGQANLIDIQSFVYVIGFLAVLAPIIVPQISRFSVSLPVAFWLVIFITCKLLFFNHRPVLGGIYTYLFITETGLLVALVLLAHPVGLALYNFREAIANIALLNSDNRFPDIEEATELIRAEMARSRYFHRALSVIVAIPELNGMQSTFPRLSEEVQRTVVSRYANARLAETIRKEIRLMDKILEDRKNGRFVILCPEADAQGSTVLIERICSVVSSQLGFKVRCGVASFPDMALTFEELLHRAERQIPQKVNFNASFEKIAYGKCEQ